MNFHSHQNQLIVTAVGASVATACLISAYAAYSRREKRRQLTEDINRSLSTHKSSLDVSSYASNASTPPSTTQLEEISGDYDEELIKEQLARNYAFFGDDGMDKIRRGKVVVVGCGGVGSWAAVMLVRS